MEKREKRTYKVTLDAVARFDDELFTYSDKEILKLYLKTFAKGK